MCDIPKECDVRVIVVVNIAPSLTHSLSLSLSLSSVALDRIDLRFASTLRLDSTLGFASILSIPHACSTSKLLTTVASRTKR